MSLRKSYFCQHNKFAAFVCFFDPNPLWLVISDWRVDKAFLHFLKCSEDLSSHQGLCSSNVLSGHLWREGSGRNKRVLSGDHEPTAILPHISCKETLPQQPFGWELSKGPPPPYLGCRWVVWLRLSPSIIPFGYFLYGDFSWGGGDQPWEWCSRSKLVFYLYLKPSADPCLHPFPVVQEARAGVFPVGSRLLIQGPLTLQTPPPLHTIPSPYD